MSDVFQEVDEELRRERLKELWNRHGMTVIAVLAAIVIGTAAGVGWRSWQANERSSDTAALYEALQDGQGRLAALEALVQDATGQIGALAALNRAALLDEEGDVAAARAELDALAGRVDLEPLWRDFARLQAARLALAAGDTREDVAARLQSIESGSPWSPLARELEGMMALEAGDQEAARAIFEALAAEAEPGSGLAQRVRSLFEGLS